jgi:Uncharacterized protein conserved in bacteria (DUF2059)
MVRTILWAPLVGAALAWTTPTLAQDAAVPPMVMLTNDEEISDSSAGAEGEIDPFAMLGAMFAAEPLTPEQEARLPQANAVIAKLMPEGAMGEMMGGMFDSILKPMGELAKSSAADRAAKGIGLSEYDLELTEEQAAEIANMFDPVFEEREAREMAMLPEMMGRMWSAMEPPMRKAMAELYAINFTEAELADIDAFFSTPTGAAYARKSFTMASDPRVMAATMEAMPATAEERSRITALTGRSAEEIEQLLAARDSWSEGEWDEEAVEAPAPEEEAHDHSH